MFSLRVAVLAVAPTTAASIESKLARGGHRVTAHATASDEVEIRARLVHWISDREIEAIVVVGGLGDDAAPRALAPLVTEVLSRPAAELRRLAFDELGSAAMLLGPQAARCGQARVFVVSGGEQFAAKALDEVVFAELIPLALHAITTGSIAVVGDLPSYAAEPTIDLRKGGKRAMRVFGGLALVCVAGLGAFAMNAVDRASPFATSHRAAIAPPPTGLAVATGFVQPPPAPPPPPVVAAAPAPQPTVAKQATPHKVEHAAVASAPAAPQVETPPALDDTCDEASCAAHGNERECCAPYRAHTVRTLDKAIVAGAIAAAKPRMLACGSELDLEGDVKLSVEVSADGEVVSAMVDEASEATLGRCVVDVMRAVVFPATESGGTFSYSIAVPKR